MPRRGLEGSTGIGHLVCAGGAKRGTDDALNNVWVVNIEHSAGEIEQALRLRPTVALQSLRGEITHLLICGRQ